MKPQQLDNKYADALATLASAETKLRRAFHRWEKAANALRRYEHQLNLLADLTSKQETTS